ncbi:MAG: TolC family protein, partial [Calditrichia bacterium]
IMVKRYFSKWKGFKRAALCSGIFLLVYSITPLEVSAQQTDSLMYLPELIQEGLQNNPELQSGYNRWQADQAKIPQAGALPDPQISFNLLNLPVNTFDFDQEPMTGKQLSLMQMFPFPGKLGLKEDIARAGSQISRAQYRELQNQLVKNIKLTFYELYFLDKSIETIESNTRLMKDFNRIAESRYTVGTGLQQDILRAQVELARLTDKQVTLQQKRKVQASRLNKLLNRPISAAVGEPQVNDPDSLQLRTQSLNPDSLKTLANHYRPLFSAWESTLKQSRKKVDLAKKGYLPDFKLGVAYTQREALQNGMPGVDFVSGLFTMEVPLYFWKKQKKNIEENRYSQIALQKKYEDVKNQVFSKLDQKFTEIQKNEKLLQLYKTGIIPLANQSLESALSGYQTDRVDFLTLLNNQITIFNYELEYYRVFSDLFKNLAELQALTGFDVVIFDIK